MQWNVTHGDNRAFYEKTLRSKGKPSPLDDLVELHDDLRQYMEAFGFLNGRRAQGMSGIQAISASEILAFLEIRQIDDPTDRRVFSEMICLIDSTLIGIIEDGNQKPAAVPGRPQEAGRLSG